MTLYGGSSPLNFLPKLHIYQTRSRIYVLGFSKRDKKYSVLKLNRQDGRVLDAVEDTSRYTVQECNSLLRRIHEGNSHHGGLQYLCKAYGIIGCFRFTEGYYLFVISKREKVGSICGHKVYRVVDTALMPVGVQYRLDPGPAGGSATERRYRKLLLGLDLTKEFYFSYSYPLPCTLQRNISSPPPPAHLLDSMFVWNSFLTSEVRALVGSCQWTPPLIHGFFQQRILSVFGRWVTVTLVARRSRHFAGTRYKKRGLNDQGRVANEVETEQIVDAGMDWRTGQPMWSSVVQMRGSIPLFWSQQPSPLSPKPDILLQRFDPMYQVTNIHFQDVRQRYGNPVVVLNLLRSTERRLRETLLRQELAAAVQLLNAQTDPHQRIWYIPWDFQKYAKQPGANILLEISTVIKLALEGTGIFVHHRVPAPGRRIKPLPVAPLLPGVPRTVQWSRASVQAGVLRTNCIDCLDRTNVAQFAFGLMSFGEQLHRLGIADVPEVDPDSSMALALMEMHEVCGHTLALQYGGSEAHSVFFQRKKGEWEAAAQSKDLVTSIKRFYSNTYTDAEKQDAINLFLGNFIPRPGQPELWELDSDYYLHSAPWLHHTDRSVHPSYRNPYTTAPKTTPLLPSTMSNPAPAAPPSDPAAPSPPPAATPFAAMQLDASANNHVLSETLKAMPVITAGGGGPLRGGLSSEEQSLDPIGYQGSEGGWDFRLVLSQLLVAREAPPAYGGGAIMPGGSSSARKSLVSFDTMIAKQPRVYQVRLYQSSARPNVMWGAVQQAFSFFWTLQDPSASLRDSQDAGSPPQSPKPSPTPSPRQQPPLSRPSPNLLSIYPTQPLIPPENPSPRLLPAPATLQRRPSLSLPSPTRIIADLAASLTHPRPPLPPTISPLNDILEIRGPDVSPATMAALRGVPYEPPPPPSPGPPTTVSVFQNPVSAPPFLPPIHSGLLFRANLHSNHFGTSVCAPSPEPFPRGDHPIRPLPTELLHSTAPCPEPPSPSHYTTPSWEPIRKWEEAASTSLPPPPRMPPPSRIDELWAALAAPAGKLERLGMEEEVGEWWGSCTGPHPAWGESECCVRAGYRRWVWEGCHLPSEEALQQQKRYYHRMVAEVPHQMFHLAPPVAA